MNILKICFQILPLMCSLHVKNTWPGTGQDPEPAKALYIEERTILILDLTESFVSKSR